MEILSPEQYLINKAKLAQTRDAYEAKAWIITAKTLFPQDFLIQFVAFEHEKAENNLEAAAKCFSYIVLTFQNQPMLWTEISKLTEALRLPENHSGGLTKDQEFYLKMFQHITYEVQHKILLLTANHLENSLDHCRLILLLMKRSSQAISQHAMCLLETLISGINSSQNGHQYREMLINEALPLILQKPPDLPTNLLNMVIVITIEHYVDQIYRRIDDETYVTECWRKIFEEVEMCGRLMKWEKFMNFGRNYGKDMYWKRLTQINGQNTKQIFYTSIIIFIYSLQEYISNVSGSKKEENSKEGGVAPTHRPDFLLVECHQGIGEQHKRRHSDAFTQEPINISASPPCHPDTPNCFITAARCWQLMNSSEALQLESNQLLVRLPIGDWVTRFLSDLAVYLGRTEDFQAILKTANVRDGIEKDVKLLSLAILQNHLSIQTVGPLILSIVKELAQSYPTSDIPQGEYLQALAVPNGSVRNLTLLPITKRAVLQYCVQILISKLCARVETMLTGDCDSLLGALLVLFQLNWPSNQRWGTQIFNVISTKRSFTFLSFTKYIILLDFIEEFAYMWSKQGGEVNLELTSNTKTRHSFGTRRADKGVKDDFKQILRDQIQRCHEDVDFLIIMFILQEHTQMFSDIHY